MNPVNVMGVVGRRKTKTRKGNKVKKPIVKKI
jgi:hypothetical protein